MYSLSFAWVVSLKNYCLSHNSFQKSKIKVSCAYKIHIKDEPCQQQSYKLMHPKTWAWEILSKVLFIHLGNIRTFWSIGVYKAPFILVKVRPYDTTNNTATEHNTYELCCCSHVDGVSDCTRGDHSHHTCYCQCGVRKLWKLIRKEERQVYSVVCSIIIGVYLGEEKKQCRKTNGVNSCLSSVCLCMCPILLSTSK